jgi:hypothetical protein
MPPPIIKIASDIDFVYGVYWVNELQSEAGFELYLRYYDRFGLANCLAGSAAQAVPVTSRKGLSRPHLKDIYRTEVSALTAPVAFRSPDFYQINGIFPLFPSHVVPFFLDKFFVYSIHIPVKKIVLLLAYFPLKQNLLRSVDGGNNRPKRDPT